MLEHDELTRLHAQRVIKMNPGWVIVLYLNHMEEYTDLYIKPQ